MSRLSRLLPIVILIGLVLATFARASAQVDQTASPASGHAQVVAQGVATLPEGEIVWQVEQVQAGAETEADVSGPAFIVSGDAGVLVSELERDRDVRLAPGESHFLPGDALATVWSLTDDDATFQVWSLVAAGDESDEALFVSAPFAAPAGERDLNLVRDVLDPNEASQIDNGDAPALILATGGEAVAANDGDDPVELSDGAPGVQTGALTITAVGVDTTTILVGLIGPALSAVGVATPTPELAPEPTETPAEDAGPGVIELVTFACPEGVDLAAATPETCDLSADGMGSWTLFGGALDAATEPENEQGVWIWSGLAIDDYRIVLDTLPAGYGSFAIDLYDFAARDGSEIAVSLFDDLPEIAINAYFLDPQPIDDDPASGASLGFTFYECPPETTTADLDGTSDPGCAEREAPFDMTLASDELPAELTSAVLIRVSPQPSLAGAWQWIDLPEGDYTLTIDDVESGDAFVVQRPCGDQSCPETGGLGSSFDFAIEDGGFTLLVYRIPES